jgi:hypothetical protein
MHVIYFLIKTLPGNILFNFWTKLFHIGKTGKVKKAENTGK